MRNSFYQLQDIMRKMPNPSGSLMKFAPFGYMWTAVNSSTLVASHTIYAMLEKEAFSEFFTVESWKSYVHPRDLHKLVEAEKELMQTGEPAIADYRLITETGRHIYVQHHMYSSVTPDGKQKIMSLVHDVTEQKRAEIILEAMNEGFFELDHNFAFRRINEHALQFWGLQHNKITRKKLLEVFPSMEGTPFHEILLKAKNKKQDIAQEIQDPVTGHWLHLSVAPYADGLIVTFFDIENEKDAERKKEENIRLLAAAKAEKALLEAEQKHRLELEEKVEERTKELIEKTHLLSRVTDVMPDLLSIIELETRTVSYINKKAIPELGFDDLEKYTLEERNEVIYPEDQPLVKKYFENFSFASDDDVMDIEYRAKIKTGEWQWFHAKGKVFTRDEAGKPTHCVNIVQNIDKRKEAEQQIANLNNDLVTKNEQLNSLNSELKQLNTITGNNYTEALRHVYINLETIVNTDAKNLSDSGRANLRRAQAAIQKMKLLTDDIHRYLDLYDRDIKKELVFPDYLLLEAKEKLQKKIEDSNATFIIPTIPPLQADPQLFVILVINIIDNSITFMKENEDPVIEINYSSVAKLNENPKAAKDTAYTIISITDNGNGFNCEYSEQVFEFFFKPDNNTKGSGIGLAIGKKIMEKHGGFITAEAKPGEGATINCYFPA